MKEGREGIILAIYMKSEIFRERYMVRMAGAIPIVVLNIIVQLLLPRAFSMEEYGYYSYNLNVFSSVAVIADLSMSNALFSKFSKRNHEIGLVVFCLKFWGMMGLILNAGLMLLYSFTSLKSAFAGQPLLIALLGLEVALTTKLVGDGIGLFDTMAISRYPVVMQIVWKVFLSIFVIAGYFGGVLNLRYFYYTQIMITAVIIHCLFFVFFKEQKRRHGEGLRKNNVQYFREYGEFCRPLIFYEVTSNFTVILMNWALLKWSGVEAQAMFGVAWQINALVSYVFLPYAELSKREFSVCVDDLGTLSVRYMRAMRMITCLSAYFAVFIGIMSEWLLMVMYGKRFLAANAVTLLIMYYTVYQASEKLSNVFLIATERTKASAIVGIMLQALRMMGTFIFQMPNVIFPDSLGGTGIAWIYLISGICGSTLLFYMNTHFLQVSYWKELFAQSVVILICSVTAIVLKTAFDMLWMRNTTVICMVKVFIAGVIYSGVIIAMIVLYPQLIGISKGSFMELRGTMRRKK